jgi:hypothetical protein
MKRSVKKEKLSERGFIERVFSFSVVVPPWAGWIFSIKGKEQRKIGQRLYAPCPLHPG